ncbi:MAG: RdgB/HAM1 family non-canonical purine NTP pyrophosphatase [Actinomycetota bacterium]|nr:RdgB/HAM1 family non-canonical purine NTP pyrophosphatase [Actinomycetota bacterium]
MSDDRSEGNPAVMVATRNEHKLRELAELLPELKLELLPEGIELPPEEGGSFSANALVKARAAHAATGWSAIADDSGIEAAALNGDPGIRSARYAGEGASDEENLAKLLHDVNEAGGDRRVAYVCALAYVNASGDEGQFEGRCEGRLAEHPRGSGGFGYDPAFLPDQIPDGRTMAELSPPEKNAISHRGRAARMLAPHLAIGRAPDIGR